MEYGATKTAGIEKSLDKLLESTAKMERQTNVLIRLTWAIVVLTFVLLLFTIELYEDTRAQSKRDNLTQEHSTQQR